jgi:hypothetical protein
MSSSSPRRRTVRMSEAEYQSYSDLKTLSESHDHLVGLSDIQYRSFLAYQRMPAFLKLAVRDMCLLAISDEQNFPDLLLPLPTPESTLEASDGVSPSAASSTN